jgi:hypothetical protein
MKVAAALWPGLALAITFVDDLFFGPLLAASGLLVGGSGGLIVAVVLFTLFVGVLCTTTVMAVSSLDGPRMERLHAVIASGRQRRHVGRFVDIVGDDKPIPTAIVAMVVSPVFAALAARLAKPGQSLHRTILIATLSYGLAFSFVYGGGGALLGAWLPGL